MYEEDDRDVNVLKTVLPLMSRHAAGYHPISYAVWYEYAKGARPDLRRNVDEELAQHERLTVALTYSIYSRYLVQPAEQALMTARTNLLELADQVKHAVYEANQGTAEFAGVAVWHSEDDASSLVDRADRALYASERAGRKSVTVDCLESGKSESVQAAAQAA